MKTKICVLTAFLAAMIAVFTAAPPASAQGTVTDAIKDSFEKTKYSFSAEGRKAWKPEFTARNYLGLVTAGPFITGGVRINDRRTLGLALWHGDTTINAAPGHYYSAFAGLYTRRYFHLGKKDIAAFYSDLCVGAEYIYKADERCLDEGIVSVSGAKPGVTRFALAWQPGIRFRVWHNLHIFFGPTIATYTLGAHLGFGF